MSGKLAIRCFSVVSICFMLSILAVPILAVSPTQLNDPYWTVPITVNFNQKTVALSDDGKIMALGSATTDSLTAIDVDAQKVLWTYQSTAGPGNDLYIALSGDGSHVLMIDTDGTAKLFDITSGNEPVWTYGNAWGPYLAINYDGSRMVIGTQAKVMLFGATGYIKSYEEMTFNYVMVDMNKTGDRILVAIGKNVLDFDRNLVLLGDNFQATNLNIDDIQISDDGCVVTYCDYGGELIIRVDNGGGTNYYYYNYGNTNINMVLSGDGRTLLLKTNERLIMKDIVSLNDTWSINSEVTDGLSISGDGSMALVTDYTFHIARLYGKWSPVPLTEGVSDTWINGLMSKDGSTVAICGSSINIYRAVESQVSTDPLADKVDQVQLIALLAMVFSLVAVILMVMVLLKGRKV